MFSAGLCASRPMRVTQIIERITTAAVALMPDRVAQPAR